jgi:hypothetical protein
MGGPGIGLSTIKRKMSKTRIAVPCNDDVHIERVVSTVGRRAVPHEAVGIAIFEAAILILASPLADAVLIEEELITRRRSMQVKERIPMVDGKQSLDLHMGRVRKRERAPCFDLGDGRQVTSVRDHLVLKLDVSIPNRTRLLWCHHREHLLKQRTHV